MTANVRFWSFENGAAVKLTIRDGHPLRWAYSERTDEGYAAGGFEMYRVGDTVICETWSDGRDCDGRLSGSQRSECHVTRLAAHHVATCPECHNLSTHTGLGAEGEAPAEFCRACDARLDWNRCERFPDWNPISTSQRDYSAEAAGY
jgi:hypothetical protein